MADVLYLVAFCCAFTLDDFLQPVRHDVDSRSGLARGFRNTNRLPSREISYGLELTLSLYESVRNSSTGTPVAKPLCVSTGTATSLLAALT